ncbi:DNA primase [Candidatus Caldatribacterium sp.]|uniref:DNA primase n=1 Tax=Candidatus Caldatribacterium sp. TaxID=2282143 RepID=UPI0029957C70|nr:DNA primase [Candidatus Caldatribacterium sp.]MDW8081775.1 DNA primase [Candidatus Calescibacterium sp.]
MLIPEEYLEEIKARADIVELISQYVDLKPSGRNFRALCPFHEEKTPSFTVSPEKGIFHCFGCGAGGNIFTFIMRVERLTFPEAVAFLAERYGLPLPSTFEKERTSLGERERLLKLLEAANHYYQACLRDDKSEEAWQAREYLLKKRGLREETLNTFSIGFSPLSGKGSIAFLLKEGFSGQEILRAGIGVVTKRGELLDRFRGRITFALQDAQGKVVGFAGRVLGEGEPKYVNSPESPLFTKGRHLYGLFAGKEAIMKSRFAILVEGYMDCLALFEHGIRNCVASMGTSLTREQAGLLKRYADRVVLCYDADEAGEVATARGLHVLYERGFHVDIVTLPSPYDPDSFLREKGKEAFLALLEKAPTFFEYSLELLLKTHGYTSLESKAKVLRGMVPLLAATKDPIERALRVRRIAEAVGVAEDVVLRVLGGESLSVFEKPRPQVVPEPGWVQAEKMLLRACFDDAALRGRIFEVVDGSHFAKPEHRRIFQALVALSSREHFTLSDLVDVFRGEEGIQALITEIASREDFQFAAREDLVVDLIRQVKLSALEREIQNLREELKRSQDPEGWRRYHALVKEREKLRRTL